MVVIPTYNEAATIQETIEQLLARPLAPDIAVVDDNSPDGTGDLVTELADRWPGRIQLIRRAAKHGLGRAYATGFAAVLGDPTVDTLVQMDADGSHDPSDVDRLAAGLARHDLVIGSRYCQGGSPVGLSPFREMLSRGGNAYARLILGTHVRDLTGGFKAWRAPLLRKVDAHASTCDGYAFQIEMTVRAARLGADIAEVPIAFHERRGGESKMNWRIAAEAIVLVPWLASHYPSHIS